MDIITILAQSTLANAADLFMDQVNNGDESFLDEVRMVSNIGQFINENSELFEQFMDSIREG